MIKALATIVRKVLGNFNGVVFDEHDIREIVEKVRKSQSENLEGYAYVTARNWAVSQLRSRKGAVSVARRKAEQAADEAKRLAHKAKFLEAKAMFWPTAERAIASGKFRGDCKLSLEFQIIWHSLFERRSEAELDALFPKLSRDSRHQHKKRGRTRLLPFAKEPLKRFLVAKDRCAGELPEL